MSLSPDQWTPFFFFFHAFRTLKICACTHLLTHSGDHTASHSLCLSVTGSERFSGGLFLSWAQPLPFTWSSCASTYTSTCTTPPSSRGTKGRGLRRRHCTEAGGNTSRTSTWLVLHRCCFGNLEVKSGPKFHVVHFVYFMNVE